MKDFELTLREELFPHWILYVLLASVSLLVFLRYFNDNYFSHLRSALYKSPSKIPFGKNVLAAFGMYNMFLLLNYFLTAGLAVYMMLIYYELDSYWLVFLPALIYLFQAIILTITGVVSGQFKSLQENILLTNFTSYFIGLLFLPILVVWMINPYMSVGLMNLLIGVFFVFYILKIIRGILIAKRNNTPWYYIILYLCNLEFLPGIVVYTFLSANFL